MAEGKGPGREYADDELQRAYAVGDGVRVQSHLGWLQGSVEAAHPGGYYDVTLAEGGDLNEGVHSAMLCPDFANGERVEVRYDGGEAFFPARILSYAGEGEWHVVYDDGVKEEYVYQENIKKPQAAPAPEPELEPEPEPEPEPEAAPAPALGEEESFSVHNAGDEAQIPMKPSPKEEPSVASAAGNFGVHAAGDAEQVPLVATERGAASVEGDDFGVHDASDADQVPLAATELNPDDAPSDLAADDDDLAMMMREPSLADDDDDFALASEPLEQELQHPPVLQHQISAETDIFDLGPDGDSSTGMSGTHSRRAASASAAEGGAPAGSRREPPLESEDFGEDFFDLRSEEVQSRASSGKKKRRQQPAPEDLDLGDTRSEESGNFLKHVESFLTEQGRTPKNLTPTSFTPTKPFAAQTLQPESARSAAERPLSATAPSSQRPGVRRDAFETLAEGHDEDAGYDDDYEDDAEEYYPDDDDFEVAVTGRRDEGAPAAKPPKRGRQKAGAPYGRAAREGKRKSFVVRIRDIKLTAAQARLYGVGVTANGRLDLSPSRGPLAPSPSVTELASALGLDSEAGGSTYDPENMHKLAQPVEHDDSVMALEVERECTFQPRKDPRAIRAMKNPKCGYDFMDRLKNREELIVRLEGEARKRRQNEDRRLEAQERKQKEESVQKRYFNERKFWARQAQLAKKSHARRMKIVNEELAKNRGPKLNAASKRLLAARARQGPAAATAGAGNANPGSSKNGSASASAKMRTLLC